MKLSFTILESLLVLRAIQFLAVSESLGNPMLNVDSVTVLTQSCEDLEFTLDRCLRRT